MKMFKFNLSIFVISFLMVACSEQSGSGGAAGTTTTGGASALVQTGVTADPSAQPSVGVPDQNSMTLVASTLNPLSWNLANVTSTISVFLADQLNNSATIADGTIVYFATEGGAIGSQCTTANGTCSVTWRSQLPVSPQIAPERATAGRDTIVAWTLGTESFSDNNSNGLFDDGDNMVAGSDIGEPFIDKNTDGVRDIDEQFVNYPNPGLNTGGSYDIANGLYSGNNCAHSTLCATDQSVFIFKTLVITNSSDTIIANLVGAPAANYPAGPVLNNPVDLKVDFGGSMTLFFLFTDHNGNPPPQGTSISFSTNVGDLQGSNSYTVPNTNVDAGLTAPWPLAASALVTSVRVDEKTDNTMNESGVLTITATPAGGGNPSTLLINLLDAMN